VVFFTGPEISYKMDASQESPYITELSGEKLRAAEQARTATMEILEDALEKRFYGFPSWYIADIFTTPHALLLKYPLLQFASPKHCHM
uniref:Uncharacterized protein n=1 Tax=Esox lucius TaxID=8010 RepID=A0A6Q2XGU9_ESOLU